MFRQLLPVSALLLGSGLLFFAGGIHSLILPVRGAEEGFSSFSLGLLGTGWAVGYVSGCFFAPRLVGSVGHIRAFAVMCAFAGIAILVQALLIYSWAWIPVRAISGFCFAGAAMIVESWLNDRAEKKTRGTIFGFYTMVNLGGTTLGQLVIATGDTSGFLFFALGAIFYALALVPTASSTRATPAPLTSIKLDLGMLWRNSQVAVVVVFLVGMSNSAFGTLAAVYAGQIGLPIGTIALFTSLPILAGALSQIPIGMLSDRIDRRIVLIGTAVIALAADAAFIVIAPQERLTNLVLGCTFGAMIFAMYPIMVAHANDHAPPGTSIQVSGGLLMVLGLGSIIGPVMAGAGMAAFGPSGLFLTTVIAHLLMVLVTVWRISRRETVSGVEKTDFKPSAPTRLSTPETAVLAEGPAR
ncbi:MAG: MFS transporter, partial [Pseudomonadota bacterium]